MADDLHGLLDADAAEDLANAVQDSLAAHAREFPGTSRESLARSSYDIVLRHLGHGDEEEG